MNWSGIGCVPLPRSQPGMCDMTAEWNLSGDWRPEQAREVLPNSLKTEIVVKANIREWRHCLTLRTSKKAHPQIRSLLTPLLKELQQKIPILFDDIKET
jgi:thymidylate synthase (FAD)